LIWQSKLSSPRAADNGIPWIFPDGGSMANANRHAHQSKQHLTFVDKPL
jgi:hypothetical protein